MFNLNSYLQQRSKMINAELETVLPAENTAPARLHKAMRYSVFTGGKRLRPVLCLAAAEAVGAPPESAIQPALAVELLHTYTLIHDDLPCMDNDDMRRGEPSSHKAFDEATAILAGDALQALAFEILTRATLPSPYPPNQLIKELSRAAGSLGVVGGQMEDILFTKNKPDSKTLDFIHLHKTADLFRTAVRMGAIAGGADEKQLSAINDYGMNLGLAFQIADDLADIGKKGKNETTCLSLYDSHSAGKKAQILINAAVSALSDFDQKLVEPLYSIAKFVIEKK